VDLNYLYYRQQVSIIRADRAACSASRKAHLGLASLYLETIALQRDRVANDAGIMASDAIASKPELQGPLQPSMISAARTAAKPREDTIVGCEALAASDLARAALMDTENGRRKLQHSAASWQKRAELLQRIEASASKRKPLDKAEWEEADAVERAVASDKEMRNVRI